MVSAWLMLALYYYVYCNRMCPLYCRPHQPLILSIFAVLFRTYSEIIKYANSGPDLSKCKAYLGVPLLIGSTEISQPLLELYLTSSNHLSLLFCCCYQSCFTQIASKRGLSLLLFLVWGTVTDSTFFQHEQTLLGLSSGWNISIHIISQEWCSTSLSWVVRFHNCSQFSIIHIKRLVGTDNRKLQILKLWLIIQQSRTRLLYIPSGNANWVKGI